VWEVAEEIHENQLVDGHRDAIGGQGWAVCDKRITTGGHNQIWGAEGDHD
jgi:hypothetical protein